MFKFTQKYFNGSAQPNYRDIPCDFKAGHETTFSDSMHDSEVNKMSITDNRESFQSSGSEFNGEKPCEVLSDIVSQAYEEGILTTVWVYLRPRRMCAEL